MLVEHAFEYAAQIERRPQVAVIEQSRACEPRPIGYYAAAAHGSARKKGTATRPMIGTAGAVHGGGAAEFRHDQHRSLQPQGPSSSAAVHSQGMQFENLARQVFIDAEFALGFVRDSHSPPAHSPGRAESMSCIRDYCQTTDES
jgi:hypothetical protein